MSTTFPILQFYNFRHAVKILEGVLVKLNSGLPWQKLHLTRRRIFLPANWT